MGRGKRKEKKRQSRKRGRREEEAKWGGRKDSSCDFDKTWSLFLISKVDEMSSPKDTTISLGLFDYFH